MFVFYFDFKQGKLKCFKNYTKLSNKSLKYGEDTTF